MGELWFKKEMLKRHSGFSKNFTVAKNLEIMSRNTKLKKPANVWLRVGRQANILANLSRDKETIKVARLVATAAFAKLAKLNTK